MEDENTKTQAGNKFMLFRKGIMCSFCIIFAGAILLSMGGTNNWSLWGPSIIFFIFIAAIWYGFWGKSIFIQTEEMAHLAAMNNLWFWILSLGIFFTIFDHWSSLIKQKPSYNFKEYIDTFIGEGSLAKLFAVVFVTMLVDFLIVLLQSLVQYNKDINYIKRDLEGSAHAVELVAQKISSQTKTLEKQASDITSLQQSIEKGQQGLSNVQIEMTKRIFHEGKKADFLNLLSNEHCDDKSIGMCFGECDGILCEKIIDSLSSYIKETETSPNIRCIEKSIASDFISKYLQQFNCNKKNNLVQANFGIMSAIVDSLYCSRKKYYEYYSKHYGLIQVVYFTTLTMGLYDYLEPTNKFGVFPSIVRQWDNYRRRTRKTVYEPNADVSEGHMWDFLNNSDKYIFRRCCLYLGQTQESHDTHDAILSKRDWNAAADKPINNIVRVAKGGNRKHPNHLELLFDDDTSLKESGTAINAFDLFRELYHPTNDCCKYMEIDFDMINRLLREPKDVLSKSFQDDPQWIKMIKAVKHGDEHTNGIPWYNIFYDGHIPVDIFAIGIKYPERDQIDWKGCLSGFVGGDFNSMELGWNDQYISPDTWDPIKAYIDFLYNNAKEFAR